MKSSNFVGSKQFIGFGDGPYLPKTLAELVEFIINSVNNIT